MKVNGRINSTDVEFYLIPSGFFKNASLDDPITQWFLNGYDYVTSKCSLATLSLHVYYLSNSDRGSGHLLEINDQLELKGKRETTKEYGFGLISSAIQFSIIM